MHPAWTAESLELHTQATIQGAFILAKATRRAAVATECFDLSRRYFELLFSQTAEETEAHRSI